MIRLEAIDETNWRYPLRVSEAQKAYVAGTAALLARAYAYRRLHSRAFLVCDGETPVGMGLYYDCPELDAYDLSQFFIDERYQRRGYARAAIRLVLDAMKQEGRYRKALLCYIKGNAAAKSLYGSFGFVETGCDGDEIVMEKLL